MGKRLTLTARQAVVEAQCQHGLGCEEMHELVAVVGEEQTEERYVSDPLRILRRHLHPRYLLDTVTPGAGGLL